MEQSDWDVSLLALVVWREASDQPIPVKQIIACTIRNRVQKPSWWGFDWTSVICKRLQYSSMTAAGDPNLIRWPVPTDASWQACMQIAQDCHDGTLADNSGGATNYYSVGLPEPPAWAQGMTFITTVGAFRLYK
jgi:N-acetylmuramoyl-L-alanine amidase